MASETSPFLGNKLHTIARPALVPSRETLETRLHHFQHNDRNMIFKTFEEHKSLHSHTTNFQRRRFLIFSDVVTNVWPSFRLQSIMYWAEVEGDNDG